MKGEEIRRVMQEQLAPKHCFVRWWRKENDFLDYDLIDRFQQSMSPEDEIGGFDLLTMDEMWEEVKRVAGERVIHYRDNGMDFIEWLPVSGMQMQTEILPYSAESLQTIFDAETEDNPID